MTDGRMPPMDEKAKKAKWELTRYKWWTVYLHLLAVTILGFALFPMVMLWVGVWKLLAGHALWLKVLAVSFSVSFGYFLFGTSLIFLCVLARRLCGFSIAPGLYSMYSWPALNWMGYNSLILIANSAFLDVLRLSPFQTLFYRMMGAKVGEGVNINTGGLADLSMLEMGDHVLVGGGVALICHAAERGLLRLAPTKLGNNVVIGLGSVVMPGCEFGDGSSVAPMSFVAKGTKVPPRGVWGGNPARDLRAERREARQTAEAEQ
jgi:acetyltransferase-like isoleucine patch superfamily enzyme